MRINFKSTSNKKKLFKYEEIINHIHSSIDNGIITTGTKLPSLRKLQKQFNCSLSVAMQAYQELEMQGVIQAVEKSGYFYTPNALKPPPTPDNATYSLKSSLPTQKSIMSKVLAASNIPDIVSLGAGIPDEKILPLNKLKKIISLNAKVNPNLLCSYTPPKGNSNLRNELSRFLFHRRISVSPDQLMITNGCMEALCIALRASTKEGDIIVIENPVFFGLINLLRRLKRKVIEIPTNHKTGICLKTLEKVAKSEKIKACLVSASFQNPLSFIMPQENIIRLLELAKAYNFLIIEDDIYSETGYIHKSHPSISSYDTDNLTIYCSSFSKSIAPGMRIGFMIPGKFMSECEEIKTSESLGGPAIIQRSMADFLKDGSYDFFIKKFRKKLAEQMDTIKKHIIKTFPKDIKVSNPQGGFFLWIELPVKVDCTQIFHDAYKQKVGIVPGNAFTTSKRYKNCLRISCGSPVTKKTLQAIKILGHLIKQKL